MTRFLTPVLALGLVWGSVIHSQETGGSQKPMSQTVTMEVSFDRAELLRRIAVCEGEVKQAEAAHMDDATLARMYLRLGGLYEDAALYLKAEDAMRRAVALRRAGPKDELAAAIGYLAALHTAMSEVGQAEKEHLEALRLRELVGDPIGMAQTWSDLAALYVLEKNFRRALDYGQRAMDVLGNDLKATASDRIAVRQTLAYALCGSNRCREGVALLKEAVELAKESFGAGSLRAGVENFLLGQAAWQCGDMETAGAAMQQGVGRMRVDMGWGHHFYVHAAEQYAQFLRQRGDMETADAVDRDVRSANALVDVKSFTGRTEEKAPAAAGLR